MQQEKMKCVWLFKKLREKMYTSSSQYKSSHVQLLPLTQLKKFFDRFFSKKNVMSDKPSCAPIDILEDYTSRNPIGFDWHYLHL